MKTDSLLTLTTEMEHTQYGDDAMKINTENTLWQTIEKEHMEANAGESITDEEWEMFVNRLQNAFADEVSELALEFWRDYDPADWD